jgi:ABC-type lipoprotein release transport system permease subunit
MIGRISAKYAFRSLGRHPRRTVLSILGVGIGCALGMIAVAYYGGAAEMQIRAACESGTGHLRIVPDGWTETQENSLRLTDWQAALAAARKTPHLKSAAVRARVNGLLAFGNRTAGVEVLGVLPNVEREANRIVAKSELEGRYLQPGDRGAVVIGKALARRLDVELDDDLMVTLSGQDEMRSAMWRIVGILATGSREIDESICHVLLEELNEVSGFDAAGEIALLLDDHEFIEPAREYLDERLGQRNTVITWKQINRAVAANIEGDTAFINLMSAIVVLVVILGITSAQLAAVLERRKEFAILTAVGLKARHLTGVLMLEALLTGVAGAVAAMLLGGPVAYWIATEGINIGEFFGGEVAMEGVLFDPIIYGDFGPWIILYALSVSVAGTLAAMIYPAWFAVRTNPADALRTV